jgi:phosphatidylserine decarboxylase
MTSQTSPLVHHRVGGWLPKKHDVVHRYVDYILKRLHENPDKPFAPCIVALQELIEDRKNHLDIWIGFHQMFDEIPNKPPYTKNSMGTGPQVAVRLIAIAVNLFWRRSEIIRRC